jgi:hypothetical protein
MPKTPRHCERSEAISRIWQIASSTCVVIGNVLLPTLRALERPNPLPADWSRNDE